MNINDAYNTLLTNIKNSLLLPVDDNRKAVLNFEKKLLTGKLSLLDFNTENLND